MFIGQLFQIFYALVDTRIVGEFLGEDALAAVGSTTTLSDFLTGFLFGLTNGFAIVIATFFGSKDMAKMRKAAFTTIILGVGMAIIISVSCVLGIDGLLQFLNVEKDLQPVAKSYISVILMGLVAASLYNIGASILRAVGDTVTPLIFLIISSFMNVGLDLLFVRNLGFGVQGAAYATIISQAVSAVACLIYMFLKYPDLRFSEEDRKIEKWMVRRILPNGISMAFMVSFVNLGTLSLQTSINTFGNDIIVAHTASRKASSIFMMPFGTLGTALATYCGQNLGAGKYERIKEGMIDTLLATFMWCGGVIIVANAFAPQLVHAITASTDANIIKTSYKYLQINTALYPVCGIICLTRNSMQGFGDSKTPVVSSVLELLMKLLAAFVLAPAFGYFGIMIAEPISWCVMVIPLIIGCLRSPILKRKNAVD